MGGFGDDPAPGQLGLVLKRLSMGTRIIMEMFTMSAHPNWMGKGSFHHPGLGHWTSLTTSTMGSEPPFYGEENQG